MFGYSQKESRENGSIGNVFYKAPGLFKELIGNKAEKQNESWEENIQLKRRGLRTRGFLEH